MRCSTRRTSGSSTESLFTDSPWLRRMVSDLGPLQAASFSVQCSHQLAFSSFTWSSRLRFTKAGMRLAHSITFSRDERMLSKRSSNFMLASDILISSGGPSLCMSALTSTDTLSWLFPDSPGGKEKGRPRGVLGPEASRLLPDCRSKSIFRLGREPYIRLACERTRGMGLVGVSKLGGK